MKFFQVYRLGWYGAIKIIFVYFFENIIKVTVWENQKSQIAYFNILLNNDLIHHKNEGLYNVVRSKEFGLLAMRCPPSSDSKVFVQVFKDQEYDVLVSLILQYIQKDNFFMIDGGANIGFTSIYLNQKIKSEKKMFAVLVEPFDDNISMIEKNLSLQGITSFKIEKAGIYNSNSNLSIVHNFRDRLEWSVQIIETSENSNLKGVQILDLMKKSDMLHIDVLKLDIEGAEKYLFMDKGYAFSFLKYVRIIAIEIHKEYIEEQKILDCLSEIGFTVIKNGELFLGFREFNK
jgi:FkbM family methyltransferase